MTEQEAKSKLLRWARAQLGYTEGADNWNKYAQKWTEAGGWNAQNQPWCDVFVDVGFIECFGLDLASKLTYQRRGAFSAKCSVSADRYKLGGAWSRTPEPGDQVFFYCDGGINHTGIVESVGGGLVTTIEGNSSDMVARRSYGLGSVAIAGYGRPDWAKAAEAAAAPSGTADAAEGQGRYAPVLYSVQINLLRQGCGGPQVKNLQTLLSAQGFDCGAADGEFGPNTAAALRAFQRAHGLEIDGEFGGKSFAALWNS